jgi:hypothetical protein
MSNNTMPITPDELNARARARKDEGFIVGCKQAGLDDAKTEELLGKYREQSTVREAKVNDFRSRVKKAAAKHGLA